MPPGSSEWVGAEDADSNFREYGMGASLCYPAHTFNFPTTAGRHPEWLCLRGGRVDPRIPVKALRASKMIAVAGALSGYFPAEEAEIAQCVHEENPSNPLRLFREGIRSCFKDRVTGQPGKKWQFNRPGKSG